MANLVILQLHIKLWYDKLDQFSFILTNEPETLQLQNQINPTTLCPWQAFSLTRAALAVSSAPYADVYAGGWGYNGFLSAGSLVIFMVPSPRIFLLAIVNASFTTFLHAALVPSFALVSQGMRKKGI